MLTIMRWAVIAVILLAFVLVPFALLGEEQATALMKEARGPWGAVTLGLLLALDIVLPIPSSIVSTACGALFGFVPGLVISSIGMTIAAGVGYFIGRAGAGPARRFTGEASLARMQSLMEQHGDLPLAACRPVPVLAEASAVFAGLIRFPFARFALWTTLANVAISAVYAAAGAWSSSTDAFLLAFAAALGIPGIAIWLARRKRGTM